MVQKWTNSLEIFFLLSEEIRKTKDKYLQSKDLVYRYRYDANYNLVLADFKADSTELSRLNLGIEKGYTFILHCGNIIFVINELFPKLNIHSSNEIENFNPRWGWYQKKNKKWVNKFMNKYGK